MDFDFSDDQEQLRDAVRKWVDKGYTFDRRREITNAGGFDRAAYTQWLQELRKVCTDKGIALILDEVFLGFRLAPGGAQEYFNVKADMVTYGKTLGGGLPVGVICGMSPWMKRFDENKPADLCFARGTFNAHPYVMTTMQVFLEKISTEEIQNIYKNSQRFIRSHAVNI